MSKLRRTHEEEPFVDHGSTADNSSSKFLRIMRRLRQKKLLMVGTIFAAMAVCLSLFAVSSPSSGTISKKVNKKNYEWNDQLQIPPPHFPWQYAENDDAKYPGLIENLMEKTKSALKREDDHQPMPNHEPSLYMIRDGILWAPIGQQKQQRSEAWSSLYRGRIVPVEQLISTALHLMDEIVAKDGTKMFPERWYKFLRSSKVSVPLFFNPLDEIQVGCKQPTPVPSPSLFPMFGLSMDPAAKRFASLDPNGCEVLQFAIPGYEFWNGLKRNEYERASPDDWGSNTLSDNFRSKTSVYNMTFTEMEARYPWKNKTIKAIWRGSTTGPLHLKWQELPRSKLVQLSKDDDGHENLLDAAFTAISRGRREQDQAKLIAKEIHRDSKMADQMPSIDYMKYKAIVDIDGNSWSSRFGMLLCTNSIVIKVAPGSVDYWFDELVPWKHYVPATSPDDDLMDRIRYVLDPTNDKQIRDMVHNANKWCQRKMTTTQLAIDMLWILGTYVDVLQQAANNSSNNIDEMLTTKWRTAPEDLNFERIEV